MELKFEFPRCGQHISVTHVQIGVTAPCPNCNAAVTVPNTSTLPPSRPPSPPPPSPPAANTVVYIDGDAKFELYVDRMSMWLKYDPISGEEPPPMPQLLFPAGLTVNNQFVIEHSNEI